MARISSLQSNYRAAQDAILNLLNQAFLPVHLQPSLIESRWHYRPTPSQMRGVCSTQGSYRLNFRYGDISALRDLARIGDTLGKHGIRFDIGSIREGKGSKLVLMVPETDMKRVIREQEGVR